MTNFNKTYNQLDYNVLIDTWSEVEYKKSKSPYSIYFYLKKGLNFKDAVLKIKEFQNNKKPAIVPTQLQYWLNKGYNNTDAIIKLQQWQTKDKSSPEKTELIAKRKDTEIKNIQKKYNINYNEAYVIYKEKRIKNSPRHINYWIEKGYTKESALALISELQKRCSPRTKQYWIEKGFDEETAIKKVSLHQDNTSLDAIKKRYNCSNDDAIDIQNIIVNNQNYHKKFSLDEMTQAYYFAYRKRVENLTNRTYKLYNEEIDPDKKRGKYFHIDHKFSIKDGFLLGVDENILSHKNNLELVSSEKNCRKNSTSSITIKELNEITKIL